eukprot:TRINITY_DN1557_c0_g1_i1.p1 TRINITY_DN1557_c0_g1~~TRINITY_DN1557_c0_g1_i1.p1  ORF type:complete len:229 (-),score=70.74 TRINITY_DN1557_c0_g1_i1:163-849(-)
MGGEGQQTVTTAETKRKEGFGDQIRELKKQRRLFALQEAQELVEKKVEVVLDMEKLKEALTESLGVHGAIESVKVEPVLAGSKTSKFIVRYASKEAAKKAVGEKIVALNSLHFNISRSHIGANSCHFSEAAPSSQADLERIQALMESKVGKVGEVFLFKGAVVVEFDSTTSVERAMKLSECGALNLDGKQLPALRFGIPKRSLPCSLQPVLGCNQAAEKAEGQHQGLR